MSIIIMLFTCIVWHHTSSTVCTCTVGHGYRCTVGCVPTYLCNHTICLAVSVSPSEEKTPDKQTRLSPAPGNCPSSFTLSLLIGPCVVQCSWELENTLHNHSLHIHILLDRWFTSTLCSVHPVNAVRGGSSSQQGRNTPDSQVQFIKTHGYSLQAVCLIVALLWSK